MNLFDSLSRFLGRPAKTKTSRRLRTALRRETNRRMFAERLEDRNLLACVDGFTCVDLLNKGQLSQGVEDVVGTLCYKFDGNMLTIRTSVTGATSPNDPGEQLGLDDDTNPWGLDEGILGNNGFIEISDETLAPLAGAQEETEPVDPPGPVTEKWFYEVRITGTQLVPTLIVGGDTPLDYSDDVTEYTVYVADYRYVNFHFNADIGGDDYSILGFIDREIDDCEEINETLTIEGFKYNDHNGNGVQDAGDEGIADWHFIIWVDSNGNGISDLEAFTDAGDLNGVYDAGEDFTDTNGDGVWGPAEEHDVVTGAGGAFSYSEDVSSAILAGGIAYDVQEVLPDLSWVPTEGEDGYSGTFTTGNTAVADLAFGNTHLSAEQGKTIGFWSNKNGQAVLKANDGPTGWRSALNSLNLRTATGGDFDLSDTGTRTGADKFDCVYKTFRTWLLGATATNMAYMLSAQLAGTQLNVIAGNFGNSTSIYVGLQQSDPAFGLIDWSNNSQGDDLDGNLDTVTDLVNNYGFANIQALIDAANIELGLHGNTTSGSADDAWRTYQEALKIAFDGMNNNLAIFAQ